MASPFNFDNINITGSLTIASGSTFTFPDVAGEATSGNVVVNKTYVDNITGVSGAIGNKLAKYNSAATGVESSQFSFDDIAIIQSNNGTITTATTTSILTVDCSTTGGYSIYAIISFYDSTFTASGSLFLNISAISDGVNVSNIVPTSQLVNNTSIADYDVRSSGTNLNIQLISTNNNIISYKVEARIVIIT